MSSFDSQVTRGTFDADETQSATEAVLDAVAAASGTDPIELADRAGPLYDAIDPTALDALFDREGAMGTVTFNYAGYRITVDQDGRVELEPASDDRP